MNIKPFLKWPGGKRWVAPIIKKSIKYLKFNCYFEPFLGGGAVFFHLLPKKSILSDINGELINTYKQVRYRPNKIIQKLKTFEVNKTEYLYIRENKCKDNLARAIRFLYLNRTCFSGIYRTNKDGKFNVPFGGAGRNPSILWERNLLKNASNALKNTVLINNDFETVLLQAREGDLVYCDPIYTVAHNNNGFVRYNEKHFSWKDQERLANICIELQRSGIFVIVSNAFTKEINSLHSHAQQHFILKRNSMLCPEINSRKMISESLFLYIPKHLNVKLDEVTLTF